MYINTVHAVTSTLLQSQRLWHLSILLPPPCFLPSLSAVKQTLLSFRDISDLFQFGSRKMDMKWKESLLLFARSIPSAKDHNSDLFMCTLCVQQVEPQAAPCEAPAISPPISDSHPPTGDCLEDGSACAPSEPDKPTFSFQKKRERRCPPNPKQRANTPLNRVTGLDTPIELGDILSGDVQVGVTTRKGQRPNQGDHAIIKSLKNDKINLKSQNQRLLQLSVKQEEKIKDLQSQVSKAHLNRNWTQTTWMPKMAQQLAEKEGQKYEKKLAKKDDVITDQKDKIKEEKELYNKLLESKDKEVQQLNDKFKKAKKDMERSQSQAVMDLRNQARDEKKDVARKLKAQLLEVETQLASKLKENKSWSREELKRQQDAAKQQQATLKEQHLKDAEILQETLDNKMKKIKEEYNKQVDDATASNKEKVEAMKTKHNENLKELKESGRLLPQFREANRASTTEEQTKWVEKDRARKVSAAVNSIEPSVLVGSMEHISREEIKSGLPEKDSYIHRVWKEAAFQKMRKDAIVSAFKKLSDTWDGEMEADIKLTTLVSDVNLDYMRDTRSKDYHSDIGKTGVYTPKTVEEGVDFPISATRRQRNNVIKKRKVPYGVIRNADGTIATMDFKASLWAAHDKSIKDNNTLWHRGEKEFFILSGDALNTANTENHTLICVRSGNLVDGFSSALNFFPIVNGLMSDKWPGLISSFERHLPACTEIVLEGILTSCTKQPQDSILAEMFLTGDLAYLCSAHGMNPPGSTHGNPWMYFDQDKKVVFRSDWEMFLGSHEKPPGWFWMKDGKAQSLDCCWCDFVAHCDEDIEQDKEILEKMSTDERRAWQVKHKGNCPHQRPAYPIKTSNTLPGLYHLTENLCAWRFDHLIWKRCHKNEKKIAINEILNKHVCNGTAHTPKNVKDEVYPINWIGKWVCNFRAKGAVLRNILAVVYPRDWEKVADKEGDQSTENEYIDESQLNAYDNLYDDESEEEQEEDLGDVMAMGEKMHIADLKQSQRIALSFDIMWDYLDELFDESWDDSTTAARQVKANKLRELGKDMNQVTKAALSEPAYSEYASIAQYVIPRAIELHGQLVLRSNEQGQESAGQLLKKILKQGSNKRRRAGTYLRKNKLNSGEDVLVECNFSQTATVTSMEVYRMRMDVIATGKSRLHAKFRQGHKQGELKGDGEQLKRQKTQVTPLLNASFDQEVEEVAKAEIAKSGKHGDSTLRVVKPKRFKSS